MTDATNDVSSSSTKKERDNYGDSREHSDHVTRPGLSIAVIFVASVLAVCLVLYNCPELDE